MEQSLKLDLTRIRASLSPLYNRVVEVAHGRVENQIFVALLWSKDITLLCYVSRQNLTIRPSGYETYFDRLAGYSGWTGVVQIWGLT